MGSTQTRQLAVNVDIDAIRHYRAIWGLGTSESTAADPIWELGVPRFLKLFKELGIRATFFVVASDLVITAEGGAAVDSDSIVRRQQILQQMVAEGHEVASHSFSHDYRISSWSTEEQLHDLCRARSVLEQITDIPVVGFRAPGYNLSPSFVDAIKQSGATYSSSRFPSPPYFAAKWLTMAGAALRGRKSGSIVGEKIAPFRSAAPYRHTNDLLELPMSVVPVLRLPAIGTFFTLYGKRGYKLFAPMVARQKWLNIEFHGIDLVGPDDPGIDAKVVKHQPDLKHSVDTKRELFVRWLERLADDRVQDHLSRLAVHQTAKPTD